MENPPQNMPAGRKRQRARQYALELASYWKITKGLVDFLKLLQVRLALSKIGWLTCRKPRVASIRIRSLGGEIHLRSHTTDIAVFNEIFVSHGYDTLLEVAPAPVRTIVDLGANTGIVSRWLQQHYTGSSIVAVEPESGNAGLLRRNLEAGGGVALVLEACAGGSSRQTRMVGGKGEFGFRMSDAAAEGATVPVMTMEQIFSQSHLDKIDLLKCDVEGAEVEIFETCHTWIDRVRLIIIELHDGYNAQWLLDCIKRNGANFELLSRVLNPAWNCETVIIRKVE